jgi:WD repeat and SOF domain-containing protein 1
MFDADAPASLGAAETGFDAFFRGAYSYHMHEWVCRHWRVMQRGADYRRGVVDPARNYPDLGPRFAKRTAALREASEAAQAARGVNNGDLSWAAVLKRTFEAYLRGERTNMYGEGMMW